ncbi:MAG: RuvX/YqgF family protein, partial [Actinomycetota bacterium]
LVVGIPIEVNEGEDTIEHPLTGPVMRFADQLHGLFGLPVHIVDERLSTHEARSRAPGDGHIDAIAAQVILETWLHASAPPGAP